MEMDKINEISNGEVICLDDDDNNHKNNGNGNNLQGLENSINLLKQWTQPPPQHIRNTITNNIARPKFPRTYERKNRNNAKNCIPFISKAIFVNNEPSTNISTGEMADTPDMPLSTSDEGSLLNQTEPSRVLPDTGFHILLSTDKTVDLTTNEDNTPKTKQIKRKKKTPKKAVASKSDTSLIKPRPKRACAIDRTAEIKKSGLWKLGKRIESKDGHWVVPIKNTSLTMLQCPICDVFLPSPEERKTHEVLEHSSLLESIHEPVDTVPTPECTASTEKLTLFNYLELCPTSKFKTNVVHQMSKRKYLLKAFKVMGDKNYIGSFECKYCPFETNLIFALWAHMTATHRNLKWEAEKRANLYCFLCNRFLTKRTSLIKHIDACAEQEEIKTNNSPKQFICDPCNESFDSLKKFEEHLWSGTCKGVIEGL